MLCRDREGLKVLTEDQTWDAAEEVWMGLENWKIASAYIQAHRIAKKVIVAKGNNDFLGNGEGIHVGVRKDFRPTENGSMVRIDGKIIAPPPLLIQPWIISPAVLLSYVMFKIILDYLDSSYICATTHMPYMHV